jgi:putative membrane protein
VRASLFRYSVLVAFNSIVVAFVVTVCHETLGLGLGSSQFVATAITTVWNYFAYKHWVYAKRAVATDPVDPAGGEADE